MPETKIERAERKQLKVLQVSEPEKKGQFLQILRFTCDDNLHYETTKKGLFQYIKQEAELNADTELQVLTFEDGGQLTKWVVTQLYAQDGKPLGATADLPSQRRGYGKSPEEISSIETQVAIKAITDAFCAGKLEPKDPLILAWRVWCATHLGIKEEKEIKKAIPHVFISKDNEVNNQSKDIAPVPGQDSGEAIKPPVTNAMELMKWARSHGDGKQYPPSWIRQQANIPANVAITDKMAQEAYQTIKERMNWEE